MKQEYKGRVLIVDDDPDIRENLCDRLAAQGYEVLSAANGREGLEQIRRELPEVVLADLQMPGMGGQALLEALRDEELETSVVVISAHGNVERAVAAMRAGAVDFVEKPFELAHLDAVVSRAAARERQRRDSACWLSERERQMPDFDGVVVDGKHLGALVKVLLVGLFVDGDRAIVAARDEALGKAYDRLD